MNDPTDRVAELIAQALTGRARVVSVQNQSSYADLEIEFDQSERYELTLKTVPESQYDRLLEESSSDEVVVLNGVPADVHERFRARNTSFVDLNRRVVFLSLPHVLVDRTHLPKPKSQRITGDPFSGKRQLVLNTLLSEYADRPWAISQLAKNAGVHVATASRTIRLLEQRSLVRDDAPGQGRSSAVHVTDPRRLLVAWAERSSVERNTTVRVEAPLGTPTRFLRRLPSLWTHAASWALTGQAGASLLAVHASFEDVFMHVNVGTVEDLHQVARSAGWHPSPSGRVHLMAPRVPRLIWPNIRLLDDIPVVSPIQLVLDLWNYPLRGREQAEHLIGTIMEPEWRNVATR